MLGKNYNKIPGLAINVTKLVQRLGGKILSPRLEIEKGRDTNASQDQVPRMEESEGAANRI